MPIPLKPFYMIRHGESTANRDKYFAGSMDVKLSDKGIKQAQNAHIALNNHDHKPDIIIHSGLNRAKHTAQIINQTLQLDMIENDQLNEHNFGDWEGKPREKFIHCYKSLKTPQNGESFADFNNRIQNALSSVLRNYNNPMIVCHGGVFRAFHAFYGIQYGHTENAIIHYFKPINNALKLPWDIQIID